MTTIQILTERIRRIISGGYPKDVDRVRNEEIKYQINSVANKLLKGEFLNITIGEETIPDGCMIATYENVQVTRSLGSTSQAKLPVTPLYLPYKMGVFSVYPSGYPDLEFIPIPAGIYNSLKKEKLLNPLSNKVYSYESSKCIFYEDLISAGITSVDMKLCVMDFSRYGDNDPLPITPEIEGQIIKEVCGLYMEEPQTKRTESDQP